MSLTIVLIAVTCLVSFPAFKNREMLDKFKDYPYMANKKGEYYRLLTCGFLHANEAHLFVNMYTFWIFGTFVEDTFLVWFGDLYGRLIFLVFYLLNIVFANIPSLLKHKNNPQYSAVGASGAVSGILFIFILMRPWSILELFFILPIPAILFGVLYLAYSSYASKNDIHSRIGHDAHFYGAVFGIVGVLILQPSVLSTFLERLINNFPLG